MHASVVFNGSFLIAVLLGISRALERIIELKINSCKKSHKWDRHKKKNRLL